MYNYNCSNHLDIETLDALAEAINRFEGGIVIVTHDQHLLKSIKADIWHVTGDANPGAKRFNGDVNVYRKHVIANASMTQ